MGSFVHLLDSARQMVETAMHSNDVDITVRSGLE